MEAESSVLWAVWTRRPDLPGVDRLTRAAKRRGARTVTVTTTIDPEDARHLAALTGLTSLDVSYNNIGAESARHLAALTCLKNLDVGRNDIGDDDVRRLAASLIGCGVRA